MTAHLLEVEGLHVHLGASRTHVLDDVSLRVTEGTTVGLVGESGSGKSTLAKTLVGVHRPSSGVVRFRGVDCVRTDRRQRAQLRREIQYIPQDPYSSLDPRRTIGQTLAEALDPRRARLHGRGDEIARLLRLVQLDAGAATRYPREFSGGERQRIAIARALAVGPALVIADEITSALDLSTQSEILALISELQASIGLTLLFVSHDLAVVRTTCAEVVVLLQGVVVERGPVDQVLERPQAPYTRALLDSVPSRPGFTLTP